MKQCLQNHGNIIKISMIFNKLAMSWHKNDILNGRIAS